MFVARKNGVVLVLGVMWKMDASAPYSVRKQAVKGLARYTDHERHQTVLNKMMRLACWYGNTKIFKATHDVVSRMAYFIREWFGKVAYYPFYYGIGFVVSVTPLIVQIPILPYFFLQAYSQRKFVFRAYKQKAEYNEDL